MELRHFEAFVAVAEEVHFSKAAERLHIAQPPLSQRIRQLEKELGIELFVRTTRSVALTPAGEALLGPAHKVIAGAEEDRIAAKAGERGDYGRVTVGFAGASSRMALPKLAGAVRGRVWDTAAGVAMHARHTPRQSIVSATANQYSRRHAYFSTRASRHRPAPTNQ